MTEPQFTVIKATSKEQIDRCMAIRLEVFCDEQGFSPDIEMDEMDAVSTHFLLFRGSDTSCVADAIGVARLFAYPPDPTVAKIGRVAVLKSGRLKGAGRAVMLGAEQEARKMGTFRMAKLHSQCVAQKFYASCGFIAEGDIFDEEGCPHIMMVKKF
ncbi:acyl-CoA N-acyltransferase [Obelidium mucronatum]|nr:acyl-CoA N-acyltransferase [Obelidium mucronatum]